MKVKHLLEDKRAVQLWKQGPTSKSEAALAVQSVAMRFHMTDDDIEKYLTVDLALEIYHYATDKEIHGMYAGSKRAWDEAYKEFGRLLTIE